MSTQIACQNQNDAAVQKDSAVYQRPSYRITENDTAFSVSVDLPGVTKDAVDLSTEKGQLFLKARRENAVPQDTKVLYRETKSDGYRLTLKIGPQVDTQQIAASLENGVLTLKLNKAAEALSRRISVA